MVEESGNVNARVWVGKFPRNTTSNDIKTAFSEFGEITQVRFISNHNRSGPYAFVQFASIESAQKALRDGEDVKVCGGSCRVGPAIADQSRTPQSQPERSSFYGESRRRSPSPRKERVFTVRIENLPQDMSVQELRRLGMDYGKTLENARIAQDRRASAGFVDYTDRRDAEELVRALDGKRMEGCDSRLRAELEEDQVVRRRRSPSPRRRRSQSDDRRRR